MPSTRREFDSLGPVDIAADRLWGAQTERARIHFVVGDRRLPTALLASYARVKQACARANAELGVLLPAHAVLIERIGDEILAGKLDAEFPLTPWISGSGTQFNMNVNEVIANRASVLSGEAAGSHRPLHPNDHVNRSQSSNDTFPTAMHLAAAHACQHRLLPALAALRQGVSDKAVQFAGTVKVARTHLMDALPMRAADEWGAFAAQLDDAYADIAHALLGVLPLALGGTAIGNGLGAPTGFAERAIAHLASDYGLPFRRAANPFAAQSAHDALARLSAALRSLAGVLYKMACDIRLLGSGPRCGLGELQLPDNEPGSSIMPGKVNPTQCEMLAMVALQVMANDQAVSLGNAGGILQMNVYKPLIICNLLDSLALLSDAMNRFLPYLIVPTVVDTAAVSTQLGNTLMRVTALAPHIGYELAARIAQQALQQKQPLRDAALSLGVDAELFDRVCDSARMAAPHVPPA